MFSRLILRVRDIVSLCMTTFGSYTALAILLVLGGSTYVFVANAKDTLGQSKPSAGKRPYNVIFVICDQESYHLRGGKDFILPARQALQSRGVTFRNHYIGSAVCTPSRALFFTGQAPQVNGVYDHLAFGFVPSLNP